MRRFYGMSRFIVLVMLLPALALARSGGAPADHCGVPPDRATCVSCHNSFGLNSGNGSLHLEHLPVSYQPGENYEIGVRLVDRDARRWGFEMTVVDQDNDVAGELDVVDDDNTQFTGGDRFITHTRNGTNQGQRDENSWTIGWHAPERDIGEVTFYVAGNAANNNGGNGGDRIYAINRGIIASEPPPPPDDVYITLMSGWNLMSSPVAPDEPSLDELFNDYILRQGLLMLRRFDGAVFDPLSDVRDFNTWDTTQAYQVKVTHQRALLFSGHLLGPRTEYEITEGWNWIPFPRDDSVFVEQAFGEHNDDITLVRDAAGLVYIPELGVNQLGYIKPGEGWYVLATADFNFVWPAPEGDWQVPQTPGNPRHFQWQTSSNDAMTLIVTGWDEVIAEPGRDDFTPQSGDELAVTDLDGNQYGVAVLSRDTLVINAWGDDPDTDEIDGFVADDTLEFRFWSADADSEFTVMPVGGGEVLYNPGGFAMLELYREAPNAVRPEPHRSLPGGFEVVGVNPNPFNALAQLTINVSEPGIYTVGIWDQSGRLLSSTPTGYLSGGIQSVKLNATGLPAGVYLVGAESGGLRRTVTVTLIK